MLGDIMPASCPKQQNVLHKSIRIQGVPPRGGKEPRLAAAWRHINTAPLKCNCENTAQQMARGVGDELRWCNVTKIRNGGSHKRRQWVPTLLESRSHVFNALAFLQATPSFQDGTLNGCAVDWGSNDNTWLCSFFPKDPGASAEWWHGHPEAQMVAKERPVWPLLLSGHKAERQRPGHKELCRGFLYPGRWDCPVLLYSHAGDVVEQEERLQGPIERGTCLGACHWVEPTSGLLQGG